jgi:hypothetical protein
MPEWLLSTDATTALQAAGLSNLKGLYGLADTALREAGANQRIQAQVDLQDRQLERSRKNNMLSLLLPAVSGFDGAGSGVRKAGDKLLNAGTDPAAWTLAQASNLSQLKALVDDEVRRGTAASAAFSAAAAKG